MEASEIHAMNFNRVLSILINLLCNKLECDINKKHKLFLAMKFIVERFVAPHEVSIDFINEIELEGFQEKVSETRKLMDEDSDIFNPQKNYDTYIESKLYDGDRYTHDFTEESVLGKGGFGTVCKAKHNLDGNNYAIKKIKYSNENESKILREVSTLATLDQENIVRYITSWTQPYEWEKESSDDESDFSESLESGTSSSQSVIFVDARKSRRQESNCSLINETLFIQMDLYGMSLQDYIDHNNNNNVKICKHKSFSILTDLFKALAYIHKKNIIHRDVKPGNILFSLDERRVLLGDFGLVSLISSDNLDHTSYIGTPPYIAPEVIRHRQYDTKSDMYGTGIIILELFVPFVTKMERIDSITKLVVNRLLLSTDQPPEITKLIMMQTESNPELRKNATACLNLMEQIAFQERIRLESRYHENSSKTCSICNRVVAIGAMVRDGLLCSLCNKYLHFCCDNSTSLFKTSNHFHGNIYFCNRNHCSYIMNNFVDLIKAAMIKKNLFRISNTANVLSSEMLTMSRSMKAKLSEIWFHPQSQKQDKSMLILNMPKCGAPRQSSDEGAFLDFCKENLSFLTSVIKSDVVYVKRLHKRNKRESYSVRVLFKSLDVKNIVYKLALKAKASKYPYIRVVN